MKSNIAQTLIEAFNPNWAKPSIPSLTAEEKAKIIIESADDKNIIEDISFVEFKTKVAKKEGIVLLGAGGDLNDWINGVTKDLLDNDIATGDKSTMWETSFYKLTTTGGRTDLVLKFRNDTTINIGKMAMWRLKFGDCSWISDYLVNYAKQHEESEIAYESKIINRPPKAVKLNERVDLDVFDHIYNDLCDKANGQPNFEIWKDLIKRVPGYVAYITSMDIANVNDFMHSDLMDQLIYFFRDKTQYLIVDDPYSDEDENFVGFIIVKK